MNLIPAALAGVAFVVLMSFVHEPTRRQFNAILVAGAGSAYLNGGFGAWEFAYIGVATFAAYKGLQSYRYIALAWWLHTAWDISHHLYGMPIWHGQPQSSLGCAVLDGILGIWFFVGAPSIPQVLRERFAQQSVRRRAP